MMDFEELQNMHPEAPDWATTMFRSLSLQMMDKLEMVERLVSKSIYILRI